MWLPSVFRSGVEFDESVDPFAVGGADLNPLGRGGGMLMDPRYSGGPRFGSESRGGVFGGPFHDGVFGGPFHCDGGVRPGVLPRSVLFSVCCLVNNGCGRGSVHHCEIVGCVSLMTVTVLAGVRTVPIAVAGVTKYSNVGQQLMVGWGSVMAQWGHLADFYWMVFLVRAPSQDDSWTQQLRTTADHDSRTSLTTEHDYMTWWSNTKSEHGSWIWQLSKTSELDSWILTKKTAFHYSWKWRLNLTTEHDSWTQQLKLTAEHVSWTRLKAWQLNVPSEHNCWTRQLNATAEHNCWTWQMNMI